MKTQLEQNLKRFKITISCVPVPFQAEAVAFTQEQAIKKVQHKARQCGLDVGNEVLQCEVTNYV